MFINPHDNRENPHYLWHTFLSIVIVVGGFGLFSLLLAWLGL